MAIANIAGKLVLIAALALAVEGMDYATGGEVYFASLQTLAQSDKPQEPIQPLPPPPPQFQPTGDLNQPRLKQPFPVQQFPSEFPSQPRQSSGSGQFNEPGSQPQFFGPPQGEQGHFKESGDAEDGDEFDRRAEEQMRNLSRSEIARLLREVNRIKRALRGNAAFEEWLSKLETIKSIVNNPSSEIDDVAEANSELQTLWEDLKGFGAIAEAERIVKEYAAVAKRIRKVADAKATVAMAEKIGLNLDIARQKISELENLLSQLSDFKNIDPEDVREITENIREGNFRDIEQAVFRIRDIYNYFKRQRDPSAKTEAEQIMKEGVTAFNQGGFREALEMVGNFFKRFQNQQGRK